MSISPRIHVLLPVHNRCATTEKFIRCLIAQTYSNWHLILIDDGSSDGTEDIVRALVSDLTVLHGAGNWWWAGSLQQGYDWLERSAPDPQDLVLIINDDTEFKSDFFANAVMAIKPRSLLLAQAYILATGEFNEIGVYWDWKKLSCTAVRKGEGFNCFSTRGLFLRVQDFLDIGGFYPKLLPHYLSDYEFTIRARRKGFSLISAPEVFLQFDDALTGIRSTEGHSFIRSVVMTLSNRSSSNPIHWTNFVLLSSPAKYVPINVVRVWWRLTSPTRMKIKEYIFPIRYFIGRAKRKIKNGWSIGSN